MATIADNCIYTSRTEYIHGRYGNINRGLEIVSLDKTVTLPDGTTQARDIADIYDDIQQKELRIAIQQELTMQELKVLKLIAQGMKLHDIAKELHIRPITVCDIKAKIITMLKYSDTVLSYIDSPRQY
jgi:ATP/maltotriose-dependent transcriptional regulator MalT